MSEEQARRVGLNEALFRHVNEQINALDRRFGEQEEMTVICECGDGECTERLVISAHNYERVRSDSRTYVVVPGHEIPEFEAVVEKGDGYEVVRKRPGPPAEVSEKTDPRS